jgi:5S rRNA maturation endonuclease (ribonuclease M5)
MLVDQGRTGTRVDWVQFELISMTEAGVLVLLDIQSQGHFLRKKIYTVQG